MRTLKVQDYIDQLVEQDILVNTTVVRDSAIANSAILQMT